MAQGAALISPGAVAVYGYEITGSGGNGAASYALGFGWKWQQPEGYALPVRGGDLSQLHGDFLLFRESGPPGGPLRGFLPWGGIPALSEKKTLVGLPGGLWRDLQLLRANSSR
jgi:hypothetical protein